MKTLDSSKKIILYDDTSSGDDFEVSSILFENDNVIVAEAENEWYEQPLTVMIYKNSDYEVVCSEFNFYYAKNIE